MLTAPARQRVAALLRSGPSAFHPRPPSLRFRSPSATAVNSSSYSLSPVAAVSSSSSSSPYSTSPYSSSYSSSSSSSSSSSPSSTSPSSSSSVLLSPSPSPSCLAPSPGLDQRRRLATLHPKFWQTLDDKGGPAHFWAEQAKRNITWFHDFHTVQHHDLERGQISWFLGGVLNASVNCIDRHLADKGEQTALLWEADEPGQGSSITYSELHSQVCKLANVLRLAGVKKGDRVCLYMPMTPYIVYAMLACARIGAVHTVVFAGFSATSLRQRVVDAGCKVVITADEGVRGGKHIPLRKTVQDALEDQECRDLVKTVLVQRRTGVEGGLLPGDIDLIDAMAKERPYCEPELMGSEEPLFMLYTSGSTGNPKGLVHSTGGYLTHASVTHKAVFDYKPGDVYACVADIGWITGHTYVVYGPLANGATTMIFESIPTYPDSGRYWQMVQHYGINQLYIAPTAIRRLMKDDESFVTNYSRSSLKVLGSVGEPLNPEAWRWYHDVVGGGRCTVVDTWWQTETGCIMLSPLPGMLNCKPGSVGRPFLGVQAVILDTEGNELHGNGVEGLLAIKHPTPGMARTIHGDHQRYVDTYWNMYKGYYFTGDGARRDEDGQFWITGRVDDVINVSGHRIGTAEIESALLEHGGVAEAAVVGFPHELKGQGIYAYVIMKSDVSVNEHTLDELKRVVRKSIGGLAVPDIIQVTPDLPKTRSGKIMRRILRKIAANETGFGDVSTLADTGIVDVILKDFQMLRDNSVED
eukprot:m.151062 g.151062  ORF g.151062 m.151062 type:complete len:752 (-) comp16191_c0_seq3:108-2363(-)